MFSVFNVGGLEGPDTIVITVSGGNVIVNVNGIPLTAPDDDVSEILVDGKGGHDTITLSNVGDNTATVIGGAGNDTLIVGPNPIDPFVNINGGDGDDNFVVNSSGGSGLIILDGEAGLDNVTVESGLGFLFGSQDLNSITVKGTSNLHMRCPLVTTRSLSIEPAAALDVNDGVFILDYIGDSPIADIQAKLLTGHNDTGNWAGPGIQSQAWFGFRSVGYAESADLFTSFPAAFENASVDNTAIIIRYTLLGDGNLDRIVDIADFAFMAASFNTPSSYWLRGDYNYFDGTNFVDFSLISLNFNKVYPADLPRTTTLFATKPVAIDWQIAKQEDVLPA